MILKAAKLWESEVRRRVYGFGEQECLHELESKLVKVGYIGIMNGLLWGVIKGHTRSLGYSFHGRCAEITRAKRIWGSGFGSLGFRGLRGYRFKVFEGVEVRAYKALGLRG